ncbi:MAG: hypothetical protein EOP59_09175 [Sphingomonadales bacterium]|nr:MAG: hypothetical protein EOP59_09175 [Sphingomonadales bacterium]
MPIIRVTHPAGAMTRAQKDALAPMLVDAVMRQEIDPVTPEARWVTGVAFNEVAAGDWYVAGQRADDHPIWLVESIVYGGFFNQARRDAAQLEIGRAFATVFRDGSEYMVGEERVSPAMLMQVYSVIVEVPEGSWGVAGRTISALEIGRFIGNAPGGSRDRELHANIARVKLLRAS